MAGYGHGMVFPSCRAAGIRQQFLWATTDEGPQVRQRQAQAHIGVHLDTQIHSAWASSCAGTLTLGESAIVASEFADSFVGYTA